MKKNKFALAFHNICKKNNPKWIKHLNVGAKSIKLLDGNILVNLHDLGLSNDFLNMPPKVEATKEKNK